MAGFSLILIGSNQGQRELIISQSIKMLAERCGEVLLVSSLYETEPWGFIAEQNFLRATSTSGHQVPAQNVHAPCR